jgi:hypothetical protein
MTPSHLSNSEAKCKKIKGFGSKYKRLKTKRPKVNNEKTIGTKI